MSTHGQSRKRASIDRHKNSVVHAGPCNKLQDITNINSYYAINVVVKNPDIFRNVSTTLSRGQFEIKVGRDDLSEKDETVNKNTNREAGNGIVKVVALPPSADGEEEERETGGEKDGETEDGEEVLASGYCTPVVAALPDVLDGLSDAARPQLLDDVITRA